MKGWEIKILRRDDISVCVAEKTNHKPMLMIQKDDMYYRIGRICNNEDAEVFIKAITYIMDGDILDGDFVRDTIEKWNKK